MVENVGVSPYLLEKLQRSGKDSHTHCLTVKGPAIEDLDRACALGTGIPFIVESQTDNLEFGQPNDVLGALTLIIRDLRESLDPEEGFDFMVAIGRLDPISGRIQEVDIGGTLQVSFYSPLDRTGIIEFCASL